MEKNKKFKIWMDEENKIVIFRMGEDVQKVDVDLANEIYKSAKEFLDSRPEKKLNVIINVNKSEPKDSQIRKILAKTLAISKMGKLAFCSQNTVQRVIVGFIAKASGKINTKQFVTEEKALEWLKK